MKVTNNAKLPSAFVNLASDDNHPIESGRYSATTLLQPTREILLKRRHWNEIEQDVSDMVWLIFGTAVHKVMENADKTGCAEMHLEQNINEHYKLTGICDLYNEEMHSVEDYKTCSVWKVIHGEFDDWKKQGLIYAWLLSKKGLLVTKLRFHALMKDWSSSEYRRNPSSYPEHPIWTWEYEVTTDDLNKIEEFINLKFKDIIINESKADDELPVCSDEERWNDGDKFAVMKQGAKKAVKVFSSESEAKQLASEIGGIIQVRKAEDRKCVDYCLCNKFCNYWKGKCNGK